MVRESDCSCPSPLAHGLTGLADQIFFLQRGLVENLNGISEKALENFPITILLDLIAERNEVVHGYGHATKHVNWGGELENYPANLSAIGNGSRIRQKLHGNRSKSW